MKPTKVKILLSLIIGCFVIISMAPPPPPPPLYDQSAFERFPPVPVHFWVQQLAAPIDGGNMIMRIKYIYDRILPPVITMYTYGDSVMFYDDGTGADSTAGDGIYAAYVNENIPNFLSEVATLQANLTAMGTYTTYNGHFAHEHTSVPTFDAESFGLDQQVELDARLIQGVDCSSSGGLLPQNSLFITDTSVVEDRARTYNVPHTNYTGNDTGVWTFGNLIKNIVNDTPGTSRSFLENWVSTYYNGRSVNGQSVSTRKAVLDFLIRPWLQKANGNPALNVIESNWNSLWEVTNESALLKNAPFKLLAIVNRLDLQGSLYYSSVGTTLAGETSSYIH